MTNPPVKPSLLLSWPFLLTLATLLVNDVYLKYMYPGILTGKLSDFAGIYLVSLIAFYLFPRKRTALGVGIVMLFTWWKSPLSQSIIDGINALGIIRYGRVIDYTDLIALVMIPVAIPTLRHCLNRSAGRFLLTMPIATLTLASILGTSVMMPLHEYTLRSVDPNERLDLDHTFGFVDLVARRNGLECVECDRNERQGIYKSKDVTLEFWIVEPDRGMRFRVSSSKMNGIVLQRPDYSELDRIRAELKSEFAHLASSMEYVESLPNYHQ